MPNFCVLCSKTSDITMHRFPDRFKFPERFKTWVTLAGGRLESELDYERFQKMRICKLHFADNYKNRNNRLNVLAIPTLHLPEQFEHELVQASTSTQQPQTTLPPSSNTAELRSEENLENALTSTTPTISKAVNTDNTSGIAVLNKLMLEHNYANIGSKPRRTSRKDAAGPLYAKIKLLRTEVSRLRKKGQSFKTRLRNAEIMSQNVVLQNFAKMTNAAQLFLRMQLQSVKKPKGRRFTNKEKVLSLSIFKKSPKCYALLCKYFTLPSPKSMKRLLSAVKINTGINKIIFEKIKKTILEKPIDYRLCSLMFDEMSLTPHINYNAPKDSFDGFATNKADKFADHSLVFMIKGLKEPFKQPIAYYFTSTLNKQELKSLIKTVVKHARFWSNNY